MSERKIVDARVTTNPNPPKKRKPKPEADPNIARLEKLIEKWERLIRLAKKELEELKASKR